jgi:hypothetical protein
VTIEDVIEEQATSKTLVIRKSAVLSRLSEPWELQLAAPQQALPDGDHAASAILITSPGNFSSPDSILPTPVSQVVTDMQTAKSSS